MILKGNIRAGGQELAAHLLNDKHEIDPEQSRQAPKLGNEKVEVAEVRGFASDDLGGAFAEAEAIAKGTNSTKPLYSLSINPSEQMTRGQYAQAIQKIEAKLGLSDQPRAVVFHTKNGRDHCHVVWSRIDVEKMQARHMEFDRQKLREVARELVRDFEHQMPKHLGKDRGAERHADKFNQVTRAEQGQRERTGITPENRRHDVTQAYEQADTMATFRHALQERGYTLAQGDKRGLVVIDRAGEVHSLTRQIQGVKSKEIRAKLNIESAKDLPSVQQAKRDIAKAERHKADIATQERPDAPDRVEVAQDALKALTDAHRAELKAAQSDHADRLAAIREDQAERVDFARSAIKEAYRPEWARLFKEQRAEIEAVQRTTATAAGRIKALLRGQAGDAFDFENRSTLAGAFKFIVKGQVDITRLEKSHKAAKRELGDMQKLAEREEIRGIKSEATIKRREATDDHRATLGAMKSDHADELTKAAKSLEIARKIIERDGRDISSGEIANRETRTGFGFGKQGFARQGMSWNRENQERDDEEREIKPPGQSFDPS